MRSIIYHRYGESAEVLQVTEAPDLPVPGEGEVLIRATSRPVHPGELIGVRGLYRAPGNISPVGPDNWSASNIGGFNRKVRVGCELYASDQDPGYSANRLSAFYAAAAVLDC